MTTIARSIAHGLVAGAAGTTALNAATYLDMAVRRRPASSTPQQTVEKGAGLVGAPLPEDDDQRQALESGLGSLLGILAGLGTGTAIGLARHLGLRRPAPTLAATFGLVMLAGNGPMTVLGVTDPRSWAAMDWAADVAPHLAYALTASATFAALDG
jgi:drug/metabolite transporter (DMT)-like permease